MKTPSPEAREHPICYIASGAIVLVVLTLSLVTCQGGDNRVVDADAGFFAKRPSLAELRARYGAENVSPDSVYRGDSGPIRASRVVSPAQNDTIWVAWSDSSRTVPEFVQMRPTSREWHTRLGIHPGMTLRQLSALNKEPFAFYGGGWDFGGLITSWRGGVIQGHHTEVFVSVRDSGVYGDHVWRADSPQLTPDSGLVELINVYLSRDPPYLLAQEPTHWITARSVWSKVRCLARRSTCRRRQDISQLPGFARLSWLATTTPDYGDMRAAATSHGLVQLDINRPGQLFFADVSAFSDTASAARVLILWYRYDWEDSLEEHAPRFVLLDDQRDCATAAVHERMTYLDSTFQQVPPTTSGPDWATEMRAPIMKSLKQMCEAKRLRTAFGEPLSVEFHEPQFGAPRLEWTHACQDCKVTSAWLNRGSGQLSMAAAGHGSGIVLQFAIAVEDSNGVALDEFLTPCYISPKYATAALRNGGIEVIHRAGDTLVFQLNLRDAQFAQKIEVQGVLRTWPECIDMNQVLRGALRKEP